MTERTPPANEKHGGADLIWGAFAGAIALGIVVMIFLIIRGPGTSSNCGQPLAPLGQSPITPQEFIAVDQGLETTISAAQLGSLDDVEKAFYGRVHNFTHNADPALRQHNVEQAKALCENVLKIENELTFKRRPKEIAELARNLQTILRDGAVSLGFPRPESGGP